MSGSMDPRTVAQLRQNLYFINSRLVNARTQSEFARLVAEYFDAVRGLAEASGLFANGTPVTGGVMPGGAVVQAAVSGLSQSNSSTGTWPYGGTG